MEIKKAIITAAGQTQRSLPLQNLVDRDGVTKTALRILIEEILSAGIEEICVVVCPGDQTAYASAAGGRGGRLRFLEQADPLGYGHAVYCAREFVGTQPFLLLVGDHLYVSGGPNRSAQQLVELAQAENCAVSAVQATHESKLPYYGTVGGHLVAGRKGLYEISEVLEKPTPTEAEQRLIVPGLRAGHYLCFFGMHVLTPGVMELIAEDISRTTSQGVHLTAALGRLARRERYLAVELAARRYDIGVRYGLLTAQLALALDGQDREEVLSGLVDLLGTPVEQITVNIGGGHMTKYVELPYNKKLNLLRAHSMGCDWPNLEQEHWCLHCGKKFSGHSARVWQDADDSLWLECGTPGCDGSPIDWAPYPWWDPKHPTTKSQMRKSRRPKRPRRRKQDGDDDVPF